MRNLGSIRLLTTLACVLAAGVAVGLLTPMESLGQVFVHADHFCFEVTCADINARTCQNGSWCNDMETPDKFPKCIPGGSIDCNESFQFGRKQCHEGTCSVGGAECDYDLRHCILP